MKKILFALLAVVFVSSLCFAQQPTVKVDGTKTFTGKVESVTLIIGKPPLLTYVESATPTISRQALWTYAKIVVITDKGDKSTFFIQKATALSDAKGNTNPPLPTKGESIKIEYSIITNGSKITNGENGAISIRYLD